MKSLYFILAACLLIIQSCTIQKRQHLPGYHIEWYSQHSRSEAIVSKNTQKEETIAQVKTAHVAATEEILKEQPTVIDALAVREISSVERKNISSHSAQQVEKKSNTSRKHALNFPITIHSPVKLLFGSKSPDGERRTDGLSIAAMICGILSFFVPVVGLVLAILAIVFGGIGIGRTNRNPELKGRGMAITGLILGILGLLFVVFFLIIASLSFGIAF